jgi:phage shock protein A
VLLRGEATHTAKVTDTALGTVRSVEHTVQSMADVAKSLEQTIADTKKRIADLSAQIGQPFEYEAKLSELLRRQQEITDKLDLAKNQAPAQLAAESANGDMPAQDADGETLGECYESEWY